MMSLDVSDGKSQRTFLDTQMLALFAESMQGIVATDTSLGRRSVVLPDVRARIAWILVNERLGSVLPRELVRMIGKLLVCELVSCARTKCVGFFKKEHGHGGNKEFCSDTCESLFRNHDARATSRNHWK